jgi:drug/metabolite transporter (DMT)-like permease
MWAMLFTVLGSFFCSGGLILMKKSHNRAELAERNNIKRNAYCDVFWLGGFASIVLGSLFNVVALGYGNVLLLASSSSLSIIFNTVFSVTLLNEKLVKKDILAMLFICIGSILFLIIAKNDPEEYTPKSLLDLITRPISIAYMALQLIYIIGAYKVVQAINKRIFNFITHISTDDEKEQVKESSKPSVKVMCTSLELVKRKIFNKISTNHNFQNLKRDIKTPMALMSIAAGVVAGLASALLKGMTISVSTTGFLSLSTICYLTIAIVLSLFQLHLINIPMKSYDQIEIIPIYQTFLILLNMASGAIILNE